MKTYEQFMIEISFDTDIISIGHTKEYADASEKQRAAASAAGRIRGKDEKSKLRKKELKQKSKSYRDSAKRHLETIRKIRKQYKQKGE